MKRFFIIGVDPTTKEQSEAITNWVKAKGAWWHWIDGMWLMVSSDQSISVTTIRDQLKAMADGVYSLVIEVDPKNWSGFGPNSEKRNMFEWIHKHWTK